MSKMRKAELLLENTFSDVFRQDKDALLQKFLTSVKEMEDKYKVVEPEDEKPLNKKDLEEMFDDYWYYWMELNTE